MQLIDHPCINVVYIPDDHTLKIKRDPDTVAMGYNFHKCLEIFDSIDFMASSERLVHELRRVLTSRSSNQV